MSNQRDIARRAGVTQATVSLALRNDPAINILTRKRVRKIAAEMGYRPNPLVATLMTHIRSGGPLRVQSCLAVLVGRSSMKSWFEEETYREQYEGIQSRAEALGYRTECFFMGENYASDRLDRILSARGIEGIVLAGPQARSRLSLHWENFAYVSTTYSWKGPPVHHAMTHHRRNVDIVWSEVSRRGYQRVGFCLPENNLNNIRCGWFHSYLYWQSKTPAKQRVPLFVERPGADPMAAFARWFKRHTPDVVIGLRETEYEWLKLMGVKVPEEVGVACVNRIGDSAPGGVRENHHEVAAAAVDLLISQIVNNERGLPAYCKCVLLDGTWEDGTSLRRA